MEQLYNNQCLSVCLSVTFFWSENKSKNEDNPKNEDNQKNEDNHKNEGDP